MDKDLDFVNRKLDALYARIYDLDRVAMQDMDQEQHDRWSRLYQRLTDEAMGLECRQDELLGQDGSRWAQRQAGY